MEKAEWKEIKILQRVATEDYPERMYRLPSGYKDREVIVYEGPVDLGIWYSPEKKKEDFTLYEE